MASPRPDKSTTELLRHALARDPAAVSDCPEPEILAAYFERSLNGEETARCELHLSGCARCREELALLERAGRDAAAGGEGARASGRWAWVWDWRWLAPAAAVLVLATIWVSRRPSNLKTESQSQPLVAMSQPSEPSNKEQPAPHATPVPTAPSFKIGQNRPLNKTQNALSRDLGEPSTNEKRPQAAPLDNRRDADSNRPAQSAGARQKDSEERSIRTETESKALADALQMAPASRSATVPPASAPPPAPVANAGAMAQAETDKNVQTLKSKQQMAAAVKPDLYAKKDEKAAVVSGGIGSVAGVIRTPDPKVLWQIAGQGILKSEDGGVTWRPVDLPVANAQIASVAAPSAQVCWLVGRDSLILLTMDGTHWQTIVPPAQANFVRVTAESASSATVATADGLRFQTDGGGNHWRPIP